ncbi:MAG: glycosyltransferase [Synergistaceae bacterium]|jgi:processive 1,2-diacylglycerol beta-glucosyltransferase|nr:glycosyltransferase [Synergistaceae bacterium]
MGYRIAVFYASVGCGHKSAAEAIKEWCEVEYPGSEVMCRDVLDYVPRWISRAVVSSYLAMARSSPWLWSRFYRSTDSVSKRDIFAAFWEDIHKSLSRAYVKNLLRDLDDFKPEAILATHFFGMSALLDKWDHSAPIYYVNTDFLSHRLQRDPRFDGWFVGSAESARQHRADNVPGAELTVRDFGIPISRRYISQPGRLEARKKLGIDPSAITVLLAGGGIGAGGLGETADSMLDSVDWRVEIICGSNKKMQESLQDKYYPFKHINVHGFVEDISDYYAASDVIALKPGGLSSAETISIGAAILLLDPLPGQEQYNCDYLLEHGAAIRIYDNRRAGELIKELLSSRGELERIKRGARNLSRPMAAADILSHVTGEIDSRRSRPPETIHVFAPERETEEPALAGIRRSRVAGL